MRFERFIVGMHETNGYIIYDEQTLEALIIDPGAEARTFIQMIKKRSLKPTAIVLTHFHCDHIGAVDELKNKYSCPVLIHKKDVNGLKEPAINHSSDYGKPLSIFPDRLLSDGNIIQSGNIVLKVIHTPGHTPGSICLVAEGEQLILTGDTLFDDDLGRTDLEGGDAQAMRRTILNKVAKWQDTITIYPGHGEHTTMKEVRRKNDGYLNVIRKK